MASIHDKLLEKYKTFIWRPDGEEQGTPDDFPIVAEADHIYLVDAAGQRYMDGSASSGGNIHGHRHPVIDAAIRTQLDRVADTPQHSATNVPAIQLAQKLVKVSPGRLARAYFSPSATLAMEAALEAAAAVRPKGTKAVALYVSSADDEGLDSQVERVRQPQGVELKRIKSPHCYRCPWGKEIASCARECIVEMQSIVRSEKAMALVIEPRVQGSRAVLHPENYIRAARDATREVGTLLIADESATAFGRTGKMFASELEDADPDILVCAKGLTGGYMDLAATLISEEVSAKLADLPIGHREPAHPANALACAAAIASLELFDEEDTLKKVAVLADVANKELEQLAAHPNVGSVRQQGLMIAIELVEDKPSKRSFPREAGIGSRVASEARKLEVLFDTHQDILLLRPPLSIAQWELRTLIHKVREAVEIVTGKTSNGPAETPAES